MTLVKSATPIDPGQLEAVRESLQSIAGQCGGELLPGAVLTAASAASHPLHGYFQWDDAEAGHQFRLAQASYLIRRVELSIERAPTIPKTVAIRTQLAPSARVAASVVDAPPTERSNPELAVRELAHVVGKWRTLFASAGLLDPLEQLVDCLRTALDQEERLAPKILNYLWRGPATDDDIRKEICPGWTAHQMLMLLSRLEARGVVVKCSGPLGGPKNRWTRQETAND